MKPFRIVLIVMTGLLIAIYLMLNAGRFLDDSQNPERTDVIIVLGGGPPQRVQRAVILYQQGYGHFILVSGGAVYNPWQTQAQHMALQANALGVPMQKIIMENRSESTYENAVDSLRIIKQRRFHSAIIVSSTYHMLRARIVFGAVYAGSGIRLVYCAATDPQFHPNRWWSTKDSLQTTLSEYEKIIATIVLYRIV